MARTIWRLVKSQSGRIRINLVTVTILTVIAAAVYTAILFGPLYVDHYKFEEKLRAVANFAHREKDVEVLRKSIDEELKTLQMELTYDAVKIIKDPWDEWIEFQAKYARQVTLVPFGKKVTVHFESKVVERLKGEQ